MVVVIDVVGVGVVHAASNTPAQMGWKLAETGTTGIHCWGVMPATVCPLCLSRKDS